jgi:myosin heavy subunit
MSFSTYAAATPTYASYAATPTYATAPSISYAAAPSISYAAAPIYAAATPTYVSTASTYATQPVTTYAAAAQSVAYTEPPTYTTEAAYVQRPIVLNDIYLVPQSTNYFPNYSSTIDTEKCNVIINQELYSYYKQTKEKVDKKITELENTIDELKTRNNDNSSKKITELETIISTFNEEKEKEILKFNEEKAKKIAELDEIYILRMEELNAEIQYLKQNGSKSVELLQKIQTLESELSTLSSSKEDEIKKISDEKDASCKMSINEIMQKKSQELNALKSSKDAEKIKELKTAEISCKKITEELNMQIQSKNVELDSLRNRIAIINEKMLTIYQQNQQLIKEKNEAEIKASKTEASQKKIEEELKLLQQQNGKDIDKKIQELTEKLRQKDVELGTINQKVLSLDEKATEASRIMDNITKEKNAVEQQKQSALDDLEELKKSLSDNTANSTEIERLQTEIIKKNDELEAKTQEITTLTSTISLTKTKETEILKEENVKLKKIIEEKEKTCSAAMPNTLSSNPREQCEMPDITELVNKYQKIFIQDPDVLFNLLLLFVINDISMYLKTIKIDDPLFTNLILVFIPLLSLFTINNLPI